MRSFWLRYRVLGIKNMFAMQYFCIFGVYYYYREQLKFKKNDEYKFFQNAAHDIPRRGRTGCL